jgi:hypothetical protein
VVFQSTEESQYSFTVSKHLIITKTVLCSSITKCAVFFDPRCDDARNHKSVRQFSEDSIPLLACEMRGTVQYCRNTFYVLEKPWTLRWIMGHFLLENPQEGITPSRVTTSVPAGGTGEMLQYLVGVYNSEYSHDFSACWRDRGNATVQYSTVQYSTAGTRRRNLDLF